MLCSKVMAMLSALKICGFCLASGDALYVSNQKRRRPEQKDCVSGAWAIMLDVSWQ